MARLKADDRVIVNSNCQDAMGKTGTVYGAASYMTPVRTVGPSESLTPPEIPYLVHFDGDPEDKYRTVPGECLDLAP